MCEFTNNYLYNIIMNERMMWKKIQKNERIIISKRMEKYWLKNECKDVFYQNNDIQT